MEASEILKVLSEYVFLLAVFGGFLLYAIIIGKQSVINVILGLYFALLISMNFPYYDLLIQEGASPQTDAFIRIFIFGIFTVITTLLFRRLMPAEFDEKAFSGLGKKLLFAAGGTILVMAFSYHVLPIAELVSPGSPINAIFGSEQSFFWWLITPIVVLFFL